MQTPTDDREFSFKSPLEATTYARNAGFGVNGSTATRLDMPEVSFTLVEIGSLPRVRYAWKRDA